MDCESVAQMLADAQAALDQAIAARDQAQNVVDSLTGLVAGLQVSHDLCTQNAPS